MFCPNCGTQLADGARFCTECGTPLASAADTTQEAPQPAQQTEVPPQPAVTQQAAPQQPVQPGAPTPPVAQAFPQSPVQQAPAQKKSRKGLIIGLVIGGVIIILGIIFAVVGMGLLASQSAPVYVRDSTTSVNSNGSSSMATMTYDEFGNLIRVEGSNGDLNGAIIRHDSNGYIQDIKVNNVEYATNSCNVDTNGRVTSSKFEFSAGPVMNATYEYYGSTNKLKTITYNTSGTFERKQALVLSDLGLMTSFAISPLVDDKASTITVEYDEEGRPTSMTYGSFSDTYNMKSRAERAGQTIKSGNSETSYDENGYAVKTSVTSSDSSFASYTYTYSYHKVENPSHAAAIFARLY